MQSPQKVGELKTGRAAQTLLSFNLAFKRAVSPCLRSSFVMQKSEKEPPAKPPKMKKSEL